MQKYFRNVYSGLHIFKKSLCITIRNETCYNNRYRNARFCTENEKRCGNNLQANAARNQYHSRSVFCFPVKRGKKINTYFA